METRNRTRRGDGRRQGRTPARSHSRHGVLLRRDRRAVVRQVQQQGRRLRGAGAGAVHPPFGPPRLLDGGRHAPPAAKLRRPDHDRRVQDQGASQGGHDVGPAPQCTAAGRAQLVRRVDERRGLRLRHHPPRRIRACAAVRRPRARRIRPAQGARRSRLRLCQELGGLRRSQLRQGPLPRPRMDRRRRKDGAYGQRILHALPARAAQHDRHRRGDRVAAQSGDPRSRQPRNLGAGRTQKIAGGLG